MRQALRRMSMGMVCWLLAATGWALEKVPAEQAVVRFAGDAIDLEVFPKPKKESYAGQAMAVGAATLQCAEMENTPGCAELKTLFAKTAGGAAVTVSFQRADTGKKDAWKPAPEQGYLLEVKAEGDGGVRVSIQALEAPGFFYAVQTLKQLAPEKDGKTYLREAVIEDWPSVRFRGVKGDGYIERYAPYKLNFGWKYIGLWGGMSEDAQKQLKSLEDQIEKLRGGTKRRGKGKGDDVSLDALEEEGGADTETDKEAKKLQKRIDDMKANHEESVRNKLDGLRKDVKDYLERCGQIAVSYNPGETLNPTEAWLGRVRETYKVYFDAGVRRFVMSFDDQGSRLPGEMEQKFGTYAKAQAFVLNEMNSYLLALDPTNQFYLCHQAYTGSGAAGSKLVPALVEAELPKELQMCWTGTGVATDHLTLQAVESYSNAFGRPATFFYQNWPITAPKTECCTGPIEPHDQKLGEKVDIHMLCSNHDQASMVAFLSGLDWAWNSEAYDPERSNKVAARIWAAANGGAAVYAPLAAIMEWTRTHSSVMILRKGQAEKTPAELAALVQAEKDHYAKYLPLLEQSCTDKKLVGEVKEAFEKRMKLFDGIVEAQRLRRSGKGARLEGAITLDGNLDEAAWQKAPVLADFTYTGGEKKADPGTFARVLYDDQFLYVGVVCEEPKIGEVVASKATGWKIQHQDYLQLNLDVTGEFSNQAYACTTVNGQASCFGFGHKWIEQPLFEVKISKGQDRWTAEFRIPLESVKPEQRPAPGRTWGFNVIRRRAVKGDSDWSYWSPLATSGDKFKGAYCGTLVFE